MSEYQISVDDLIFFIDVISYHPAVKGEFSYNSVSDLDYYGYDAEVYWECNGAFPEDGTEPEQQPIDIDKYSKQITEKLLDILSELSENSRQEELERVVDMEKYWKYY